MSRRADTYIHEIIPILNRSVWHMKTKVFTTRRRHVGEHLRSIIIFDLCHVNDHLELGVDQKKKLV